MSSYQVLFSGDLVAGTDKDTVQSNLARELGIDAQKSQALFSGRTVVLRSQLAEETALEFMHRMNDMGAICRIKDLEVNAPEGDPARYRGETRSNDHTLRDITAAHLECPRCSHLQLDTSHCARCGVDMVSAAKQKRKEDLIIEKKIRMLRTNQTQSNPVVPQTQLEEPERAAESAVSTGTQQAGRMGKMMSWLRRSNA